MHITDSQSGRQILQSISAGGMCSTLYNKMLR